MRPLPCFASVVPCTKSWIDGVLTPFGFESTNPVHRLFFDFTRAWSFLPIVANHNFPTSLHYNLLY